MNPTIGFIKMLSPLHPNFQTKNMYCFCVCFHGSSNVHCEAWLAHHLEISTAMNRHRPHAAKEQTWFCETWAVTISAKKRTGCKMNLHIYIYIYFFWCNFIPKICFQMCFQKKSLASNGEKTRQPCDHRRDHKGCRGKNYGGCVCVCACAVSFYESICTTRTFDVFGMVS